MNRSFAWQSVFIFLMVSFANDNTVFCRQQQQNVPLRHTSNVKRPIQTVLVTGSNGYVASWIVKELLGRGYNINACVRDATNTHKVEHLRSLMGPSDAKESARLKLFSTGDLATADDSVWDAPLRDCQAVIHASMVMDWNDGVNGMYYGTMEGTRRLLKAMERHLENLKVLVLTSSTAAVDTQTHGVTDESHWRNAQYDLDHLGSYYSATKISQEELISKWAQQQSIRYVSICPTRVIGPPIGSSLPVDGWLNQLRNWLQHPPAQENETMELVHVQDVALFHIAAMENADAHGRYLCVDESWHWNDFLQELRKLHSEMPSVEMCQGDHLVPPKQYSQERRNSLSVAFRPMKEILQECVDYLKARGELGNPPVV